MEHNGRLLCPLCRKTHTNGIIKPGITLCVPCAICKATYDAEDLAEILEIAGDLFTDEELEAMQAVDFGKQIRYNKE